MNLRVKSVDSCFLSFFFIIDFFFNIWINWKLNFYKVISISWPELRVWRVKSGCLWSFFFLFVIDIVFQFHLLMLDWLRIELHNLYWFAFYWVILFLWSRFNPGWVEIFYLFFFQFHSSTLSWLIIEFRYVFYLYIISLSRSYDPGCEFYMLV